ncbi:hypothetical protein C8Q75DRAFT_775885 [Abortiporus biennis]|nr:hypothetical protein C8Q75DRAFT_775885 [Abortiporus biennis]
MHLTTGPPLLFALGIRIIINLFNPEHSPSISDHILLGLWQGVLLYHTLIHLSDWVFPVAFGIAGKLLFDFTLRGLDTTNAACTLLGVALGVLVTNVLSVVFEEPGSTRDDVGIKERERGDRERERYVSNNSAPQPELPSRRTRLVSFDRSHRSHRKEREREREREQRERERNHHDIHRQPQHPNAHYDPALRNVVSPVPTLAYSIDTAPSISIDSVSSSIDPHGTMTPQEREVAILRRRASLADSERRRFKEERKWALSQGNKARANQLAWQVKRFTALMESFHREADAKVVEAARAASQPPIPFPSSSNPGPSHPGPSTRRASSSQPQPSSSSHHIQHSQHDRPPLVSVTVGTAPTHQPANARSRKRSGGSASGILKPAIHVHGSGRDIFIS